MVRHIVSWNFKPELTEEQRQAVREEIVPRINALKELVPCALEVKASCPPLGSILMNTAVANLEAFLKGSPVNVIN